MHQQKKIGVCAGAGIEPDLLRARQMPMSSDKSYFDVLRQDFPFVWLLGNFLSPSISFIRFVGKVQIQHNDNQPRFVTYHTYIPWPPHTHTHKLPLCGCVSHSAPLFQSLNILNVYDTYKLEVGVFMFRHFTNQLPNGFQDSFSKQAECHKFLTRNANDLL